METYELIEKINAATEWNHEDCAELCRRADMTEEWEAADGDTFEAVVYEAMRKLDNAD